MGSCGLAFGVGTAPPVPFITVDPVGALAPLPLLDPLPPFAGLPTIPDAAPADPPVPVEPVTADPVDNLPWIEGEAPGVVENVLAITGTLAATSQANALATIEALASYAAAFVPLTATVIPTTEVAVPALGDAPAVPDLTANFATAPDDPGSAGAPALDIGAEPAYDVADIALMDIPLPDPFSALLPTEPALEDVINPIEPDMALPAVPTLQELNIPDAPTITFPTLDSTLPAHPDAPTVAFAYSEVAYQSTLLTSMNARLATMVVDMNSTGLIASVENAIWNRAADREALLTHRATGEAVRMLQARGFAMPPQTLTRVVQQALQGGLNRNASLQREVIVGQAKLRQQNFKFAIEAGVSLEGRMIEKHNAAQARALEAAKAMVTAEIQIFNGQVQLYLADIQAFAVKAQVFKARLEEALARVEVYKAQLEAERAKGEINAQRVVIYRAQIEGLRATVEVYRSRVDAAKAQVENSKSVVDAFRARVQAFDALVSAKVTEYDAYAARVKGQAERAMVFGKQVEAFKSRVVAFDALVKAKIGVQELRFKQTNEFPLQLFTARIDAYKVGVGAVVDRMKATASVFSSQIKAFAAQEGAKSEYVAAEIKVMSANAEAAIEQARGLIDAGKANLEIAEVASRVAQDNLRSAGQLAGQLAAGAVAAQSVHASISESGSYGIENRSADSATNGTNVSALTSTGSSSTNNQTTSTTRGTSLSNTITNTEGRRYSRGISNQTSTASSSNNSTTTTAQNNLFNESSHREDSVNDLECTDRTTYND